VKEYYIGCSGWFYLHWKNVFYPEELKNKEWFSYYSKIFKTVEINSTFYSMPDLKKVKLWYNTSTENFIFSIKANKYITHIKRLNDSLNDIKEFVSIIDNLKDKLGLILYQMPPSFKYSEENLNRIINNIPPGKSVVEFRNISWFNKNIFNDIINYGIHIASISSMEMPLIFPDDNIVYFRLHGDINGYATDYNKERLEKYYNDIKETNADKIYLYFNNDYNGFAPKNALNFIDIVNKNNKE